MANASPWGTVKVDVPTRGSAVQPRRQFGFQSFQLSWSWGSEASTAELLYLGDNAVVQGAQTIIEVAGYKFYGTCRSDMPMESSSGKLRALSFVDNRDFLEWDRVFCAFNLPDERIVAGVRQKRYRHLLPLDYASWKWTFTPAPYQARQIIKFLLGSPTVFDNWATLFHVDQKRPVFDLDFTAGPSLKTALTEVTNKQGLVFTLMGGPWRLVWARKGEGELPTFTHYRLNVEQTAYDADPYLSVIPSATNNRSAGTSLSGNATRIRVLGDRNNYQVHDISVFSDWSSAWEQFFDANIFYEKIYKVGKTKQAVTLSSDAGSHTFPAGTKFIDIGAYQVGSPLTYLDQDQIVSRQLARACALEITVREYAALVANNAFLDTRKFATRSRLDMPAVLYINQILFRAFRFPSPFAIVNADGNKVPLSSLAIAQKMIAKVTHDPLTGVMAWDTTENADGNGYGIVKGYNIGRDLFRTIRPDRFDLSKWNDSRNVWEHIEFQVDDSGDVDGKYILFDEPIINSSDLIQMVDGYGVFKARPFFTVPEVNIALTFDAEKFLYTKGEPGRDAVENVSGLNGQFVSSKTSTTLPVEVAYASGKLATEVADEIAVSLLSLQYAYSKGRYTRFIVPNPNGSFPLGLQLNGLLDRITVTVNASGCTEEVDLTTEAPRQTFIPERDLERNDRINALLPGQAELRQQANLARLTAAALQKSPEARKTASNAFKTVFGSSDPVEPVIVAGNGASVQTLAVGTPLQKQPTKVTLNLAGDAVRANTTYSLPGDSTDKHTEFGGVTVRDSEPIQPEGSHLEVQRSGDILVRVKGPAKVNDTLSLVTGHDYLSGAATKAIVGKALQQISGTDVKLIRVRTSSASAAVEGGFPYQLIRTSDTTAKIVPNSRLLRSLNWRDRQHVYGLDLEFPVVKDGVVYLETHFDNKAACILANIAVGSSWNADVFPAMTRIVTANDGGDIGDSKDRWVEELAGNDTTQLQDVLTTAFAKWDNKKRHWQTFTLIGNFVKGTKGLAFTIGGESQVFQQCLDTDLMLTGFCDNGRPAQVPIACAQPLIEAIVVTVEQVGPNIVIDTEAVDSDPSLSTYRVFYTTDGTDPTKESTAYVGPFTALGIGSTVKVIAYADVVLMNNGVTLLENDFIPGTGEFSL